jgi:hypothetical protein
MINMKLETRIERVVDVDDWDELVENVYGRRYTFQQQDGCRSRGTFRFTVPEAVRDFENDSVPEIINHSERGVSFSAWLERDPKSPLASKPSSDQFDIDLWWARNFYPHVQVVANDLHEKGLLEAGSYTIDID